MPARPLHLRIFVSSPGDTADERGIALSVIDRLQYDPFLRGVVTLEGVAWDRPGAATPMLATRTPQAAIDDYLPRPSACDIVVVLMWARMGTPLGPDATTQSGPEAAQSGTAWEFDDAMRAARQYGRPEVVVYRRTEKVLLDDEAPDYEERLRQKRLVREFFERFSDPQTGAILQGYNSYITPEEFRQRFETDLKAIVNRSLLRASASAASGGPVESQPGSVAPLWQGSPFPGLRAFVPSDAPIFFGRGREIDALLKRLADSRFVAVVGASGSGKSSLVGAGGIPRLADGALPGSSEWLLPTFDSRTSQWSGMRFTPRELGSNPFVALAVKLAPLVGRSPRDIAAELADTPSRITQLADVAVSKTASGAELLFFVDQFEELFALVGESHIAPFVALLEAASQSTSIRTVVTMRSDFYHRCLDIPSLARLFELAQLPLPAPTDTLLEMITRPAERAGLRFEEGLAGRILSDTQRQPGALPLLAYALDGLYTGSSGDGVLSHAAYQRQGGVQGAIGTRAEDVFGNQLDDQTRATFAAVFRELLEIDEYGRATRRRAPLGRLSRDPNALRFVELFTAARLFVSSRGNDLQGPVVEVAHEALFESWPRLSEWVRTAADDLRLLQKVSTAAREWEEHGRDEAYLWLHERLEPVYEMLRRLDPELDEVTRAFTQPEYERLLRAFADHRTEAYRRQVIGDRLLVIGAVTIPGLVEALQSEHPAVRTASAEVLARFGEASLAALTGALDNASPEVRLVATGALRQNGAPGAVAGLLRALHDADARVRSQAAGALRGLGADAAAQPVAEALQDADVDVRWHAVGILGAFGSAAASTLVPALCDPDPDVRALALKALSAAGEAAVEPLVSALVSGTAAQRVLIADGIVALGSAAVPAVGRMLAHADLDVRSRAIEILGAIGDRTATTAVLEQLQDSDAGIRLEAANALVSLADTSSVHSLCAALYDTDPDVQWTVGEALASVGGRDVVERLLDLLRDRPPSEVVAIIASTLRTISPAAAVWHLIDEFRHVDTASPQLLKHILAAIGSPAVPDLLQALHAPDSRLRAIAEEILCAMDQTAAAGLIEATLDPDYPEVRSAVARIIGRIGAPLSVSRLIELLADTDERVSAAAAEALGRFGESAITSLVGALQHASPPVRQAAARSLVAIGSPAVPVLLEILNVGEQELANTAAQALESMATMHALTGLNRWRDAHSPTPAQAW